MNTWTRRRIQNLALLITFIILILLLMNCDGHPKQQRQQKEWTVITIDGCEYILGNQSRGYGGYGYLTVKANGNCGCGQLNNRQQDSSQIYQNILDSLEIQSEKLNQKIRRLRQTDKD